MKFHLPLLQFLMNTQYSIRCKSVPTSSMYSMDFALYPIHDWRNERNHQPHLPVHQFLNGVLKSG